MLLVVAGSVAVLCLSNLIAFVMHDKKHANRAERGWDDENQNPALQRLDHLRAGKSSLRVAKRAALREGWQSAQHQ